MSCGSAGGWFSIASPSLQQQNDSSRFRTTGYWSLLAIIVTGFGSLVLWPTPMPVKVLNKMQTRLRPRPLISSWNTTSTQLTLSHSPPSNITVPGRAAGIYSRKLQNVSMLYFTSSFPPQYFHTTAPDHFSPQQSGQGGYTMPTTYTDTPASSVTHPVLQIPVSSANSYAPELHSVVHDHTPLPHVEPNGSPITSTQPLISASRHPSQNPTSISSSVNPEDHSNQDYGSETFIQRTAPPGLR